MWRKVVRLTLDHLEELTAPCRSCLFWQLDPVRRERVATRTARPRSDAWVSAVLREWGSCGRVALVDGVPMGFALYAPEAFLPGRRVVRRPRRSRPTPCCSPRCTSPPTRGAAASAGCWCRGWRAT